jgi:hypothetical protein
MLFLLLGSYDVPKIIRLIREARSRITAEDLISALKGSSICGDNLAGLVIHATGTWLMKKLFRVLRITTHLFVLFSYHVILLKLPFRPSPSDYLKMAKSITKYFPCMENKVSKNCWVSSFAL